MTELFIASMDDIGSIADITKVFDSNNGWTYDATGGIAGRAALTNVSDDQGLVKVVKTSSSPPNNSIRYYCKFKCSASGVLDKILYLSDSATTSAHIVRVSTAGVIGISLGDVIGAGVSYFYGSINICDGSYHTIQIYIFAADDATGVIQVWVDDVLEIDRTGVKTGQFSGSQYHVDNFDRIEIFSPNTTGWIDDVIVWDDEVGGLAGKIVGVPALIPLAITGPGDSADMTPTSGANWENVDDLGSHDGDTTTVSSSVAGHKDLYAVAAFPGGISSVAAVLTTGFARADEGAQTNVKLKIKTGITEADGAIKLLSGSSYKTISGSFPVNPDTTLAWGLSDIIQIGQEIV